MTFNTGQEKSYSFTTQEMQPLWNNVLNSYRQAQKEIEAELAKVYAKYYNIKNPRDIYNLMIQKDRLTSLLQSVTQSWNSAARKAGIDTVASSQVAISNAYYRSQYTLNWFSPEVGINMDFAILPEEVINASVFGTEQAWKNIQTDLIEDVFGDPSLYFRQTGSLSKLLLDKKNTALRAIQQTITTGLIQGNLLLK
jgi:hypothetical protein